MATTAGGVSGSLLILSKVYPLISQIQTNVNVTGDYETLGVPIEGFVVTSDDC